jgi:cyclophilin family peptidyl-prolyl cis-trans isomerase/HEAT repeat protein
MKHMNRIVGISVGLLLLALAACSPYEEDILTDVKIDLKDPVFRQIYDLQDRQQSDSLYLWFSHDNPTYRYLAAMAFASIKDTAAVSQLALLLYDRVDEVRAAAAYAIGQTGAAAGEPLLMAAFDQTDTFGLYLQSNRAILEAVGKCGTLNTLRSMSTVSTYLATDTLLLEGQAYGIYRFALRDITTPEGTARMLQLAADPGYPESVRLVAANYLSRTKNIEIDSAASLPLVAIAPTEPNADIRMAIALGLGKAKNVRAMQALLQMFSNEKDYRVKCNILRALGSFDYGSVQATVVAALKDPDPHVSARAAQFFLEHGNAQDAPFYWRAAKDSIHWSAQLQLYAAAQRHLSTAQSDARNTVNWELRQRYAGGISPYQKAAALRALAEFPWNFRFIQRESYASPDAAVRTAGVEALAAISDRKDFNRLFGENSRRNAIEFALYFKQAIQTGDPAMIATAAGALRHPDRSYKTILDSLGFLDAALAKLELPREVETYNELRRTIDFFAGKPAFVPEKPAYNRPIDWTVLDNLNMEPTAIIRTSKGNIRIRLLPSVAPGSVINFMKLAREKFYDGKNFHRVVSNFVIQGGCSRGDGYGSLDYSIRSELPPRSYDREGLVGMASAGNHTEGTQFFITHSPALHLDGNYTIFARVIDGMDVVHQIQPGSKIESIIIQ